MASRITPARGGTQAAISGRKGGQAMLMTVVLTVVIVIAITIKHKAEIAPNNGTRSRKGSGASS